jgi:hypothetical protein
MKKYIALLVIVSLFACKEAKKEVVSVSENLEVNSKPEVKLYTFDGGTVVVNTLGLFALDESYKGQSKEFADAFYVIKHPEGNLMWDAGLP